MTEKKSPPSGKEEVTDVLSSIRRLVSDELREKTTRRVQSDLGVLSLDNDVPEGDSPPLVLSGGSKPALDLRPDPPLTAPKPGVSKTSGPSAPSAPVAPSASRSEEETGLASEPKPDMSAPKREAEPAPKVTFDAAINRVRPLPTEGRKLPRPISFDEDFDTPAPTAAEEPVSGPEGSDLDVSGKKDEEKPAEEVAPLPEATLVERAPTEPAAPSGTRRDFAPRQTPAPRTPQTAPGLEEKLSPFALASLNKAAEGQEDRDSQSGDAGQERAGNSGLINPFAKNRIARDSDLRPVEKSEEQEPDASPEGTSDPEFDSFQSAEAAFAELSQATEALKSQGAFSGVRSVIEAAGLSYTGVNPKPEEPAEAEAPEAAPTEEEPAAPAPFYDEAELRQVVTDIVREELAGELGEKLSRNIRKIIRREIALALSDEDGSGILGD